jgi:beta-galactosidase
MAPLYQSSRSWNSSASPAIYNFTVPNGTYGVVLKFAETSVTKAGQRIFNILINDQSILTNFDVFASAGGANIALDKQYTVAVSQGQLAIALVSVTGSAGTRFAMLSAIQITSTSAQSPYDVVAKFHPAAGATSFSLPDIPMIGTLRVYRNGLLMSDGGDYFVSDDQLWFQSGQSLQATDLIQVIFKH